MKDLYRITKYILAKVSIIITSKEKKKVIKGVKKKIPLIKLNKLSV